MSELSSTSCNRDNKCDNGFSPLLLILLLCLCQGNQGLLGGNGGLFGGCSDHSNGCSLCGGGMEGILPILLLLMGNGAC